MASLASTASSSWVGNRGCKHADVSSTAIAGDLCKTSGTAIFVDEAIDAIVAAFEPRNVAESPNRTRHCMHASSLRTVTTDRAFDRCDATILTVGTNWTAFAVRSVITGIRVGIRPLVALFRLWTCGGAVVTIWTFN